MIELPSVSKTNYECIPSARDGRVIFAHDGRVQLPGDGRCAPGLACKHAPRIVAVILTLIALAVTGISVGGRDGDTEHRVGR